MIAVDEEAVVLGPLSAVKILDCTRCWGCSLLGPHCSLVVGRLLGCDQFCRKRDIWRSGTGMWTLDGFVHTTYMQMVQSCSSCAVGTSCTAFGVGSADIDWTVEIDSADDLAGFLEMCCGLLVGAVMTDRSRCC
jgi:hypothetical protein